MGILSGRSGVPPNQIYTMGLGEVLHLNLPMGIKAFSSQTFGLQTEYKCPYCVHKISTQKEDMTRKTATPDEISEALALREAGYTALSISQKLGISVRSLHRHFADHGARKGTLKQEVLDAARVDLLKRVTSDDAIREEAAKLINDDLAHALHLRSILISASEQLQANSLKDAVLVMRAAAAYSTAIKNTSDMLRHTLQIDRTIDDTNNELPELIIRELTQEDIAKLRAESREEEVLDA